MSSSSGAWEYTNDLFASASVFSTCSMHVNCSQACSAGARLAFMPRSASIHKSKPDVDAHGPYAYMGGHGLCCLFVTNLRKIIYPQDAWIGAGVRSWTWRCSGCAPRRRRRPPMQPPRWPLRPSCRTWTLSRHATQMFSAAVCPTSSVRLNEPLLDATLFHEQGCLTTQGLDCPTSRAL